MLRLVLTSEEFEGCLQNDPRVLGVATHLRCSSFWDDLFEVSKANPGCRKILGFCFVFHLGPA